MFNLILIIQILIINTNIIIYISLKNAIIKSYSLKQHEKHKPFFHKKIRKKISITSQNILYLTENFF